MDSVVVVVRGSSMPCELMALARIGKETWSLLFFNCSGIVQGMFREYSNLFILVETCSYLFIPVHTMINVCHYIWGGRARGPG